MVMPVGSKLLTGLITSLNVRKSMLDSRSRTNEVSSGGVVSTITEEA